jgi:hypothetical protein
LYADLSLPGWWPEFDLKTYSAWAPNWRDQNGAGRALDITQQKTLMRTLKVPMRNNSSDMNGLTAMLLRAANQPVLHAPRITHVEPSEVSACDGVIDFQILGDNVWRTNMVHLGGKLLEGQTGNGNGNATTAIRLLPDMRGIVASLKVSDLPLRRGKGVELTVWTPDGHDSKTIKFKEQLQQDSTCLSPEKTYAPTITEIRPATVSACDGKLKFQVLGENLTADAVIIVGGVAVSPVTALPSKAGLAFDLDPGAVREINAAYEAVVNLSNTRGDASAKLTYSALKQANDRCIAVNAPTIENVIPDKISLCNGVVSLNVTGNNLSNPLEAALGAVKAKSVQELPPNNGSVVNMTVDMKASSAALNGLADTTVSVRTHYGIASSPAVKLVPPQGDKCP